MKLQNLPQGFLSVEGVASRLGVTSRTVQNWTRAGEFPKGLRFGPRAIIWRETDVDNWLANLSRQAPAAEAAR